MNSDNTIFIDELEIAFTEGQTIMEAALEAGEYIPHLCHHPDFTPHGSCRVCLVKNNGRFVSACTHPARAGEYYENDTDEINAERRSLLQMLFVEGNHVCPGCEKSGACQLQAVAYYTEMLAPHYTHFFPQREVDASHPDVAIDFNRCILCELCVRASRDVDGKHVFVISGRGREAKLIINSPSGKLGDSTLSAEDKAADICPVGAILSKHTGFAVPIGERLYDKNPINIVGDVHEPEKEPADG